MKSVSYLTHYNIVQSIISCDSPCVKNDGSNFKTYSKKSYV